MLHNFPIKILLNSTHYYFSFDILIIFFEFVAAKNFITKACIRNLKSHKVSVWMYEKCKFSWVLFDLNVLTSKIEISITMFPNFMMNVLLKSPHHYLSIGMFFIFFECVGLWNFTTKGCVCNLKYRRFLISIYRYWYQTYKYWNFDGFECTHVILWNLWKYTFEKFDKYFFEQY